MRRSYFYLQGNRTGKWMSAALAAAVALWLQGGSLLAKPAGCPCSPCSCGSCHCGGGGGGGGSKSKGGGGHHDHHGHHDDHHHDGGVGVGLSVDLGGVG